jgi:hypothetical protein
MIPIVMTAVAAVVMVIQVAALHSSQILVAAEEVVKVLSGMVNWFIVADLFHLFTPRLARILVYIVFFSKTANSFCPLMQLLVPVSCLSSSLNISVALARTFVLQMQIARMWHISVIMRNY